MGKYEKLTAKILSGTSDANVSFSDICQLIEKFGFDERIRLAKVVGFVKTNFKKK